MTLNLFTPRVCPAGRDGGLAAILFLLLALVFAPVVGLHVALAFFGSDMTSAASSGPDSVASAPASTRARG